MNELFIGQYYLVRGDGEHTINHYQNAIKYFEEANFPEPSSFSENDLKKMTKEELCKIANDLGYSESEKMTKNKLIKLLASDEKK